MAEALVVVSMAERLSATMKMCVSRNLVYFPGSSTADVGNL